jgi:hypothetical protein
MLNEKGFKTRAEAEWSPTTVWIIVQSPFYAGFYRYNRYKGVEHRTENPEEEWVMVENHHPAIFTVEEWEKMCDIRDVNSRQRNAAGKQRIGQNVYVFGGISYCAKCGSKLVSTPGRLHVDGYRTSNYSCPKHRKTKECDSPTVSDTIIGEFVINYIVNMLAAKRNFSSINSPEKLQARLLHGSTFSQIQAIEPDGLHDFYNLLSRYGSDDSYVFSTRRPKKQKATVDPEVESLRKERERQERALRRLQELFLYSEDSISEKDFIIRKKEITGRIEEINSKLGMITHDAGSSLTDEDFIRQASHLLIASKLQEKEYVYYKNLAASVSPEILREYIHSIVDSIRVLDGQVSAIVFKNGLTHKFIR